MEDPTAEITAARSKPTRAERAVSLGEVLNRLPGLASHVKELRQAEVKAMHDEDGMSWDEVGKAIGQHRNRAQQIAKGVTGGRKRKAPPTDSSNGTSQH